ncbi:uncharacterized protein LOC110989575 [Acanthaster planci]|uniref:Uncharacterized protein LOC110989575 n=1 Tax=Acanthaster planci TaxID=133434 RepID=A0A8B7ZXE6_ACAPL|nr:uncharacterized protein LOC110989575 [Acanthaster planci]
MGLLLDLRGKPARQSSSLDSSTTANKAVDGDRDTFMHTGSTGDHWWKVDLEAIYSLANITIINRRGFGHRLAGAVIRAGLDPSDFSLNRMIGSVSSSQATNGAVVDFMMGPNVSARYVSVELAGPSRILHMAEVMVDEEITPTEETNSTVTPVSTSGSTTTGQQDTLTEGNPSITEQGSTITSTTTSITSTASRTLVSTKPQPSIETITKDFPPITSTSETVTAGLTWVTTTLSPSSETAIKG